MIRKFNTLDDCDLITAKTHEFVSANVHKKPSPNSCLLAQYRKMCNFKCKKITETYEAQNRKI